jgi:hypothetical protein
LKSRLGYLLWVIRYGSWFDNHVWVIQPMIFIDILN